MQDDSTVPTDKELFALAEKEMQKAYFAFEDEMLAIEKEVKKIKESRSYEQ